MISGILNINKPSGITSYGVVRVIKSRLNMKKVGHCGTLDPLAKGVLLVCFGSATKLFESLSREKKVYETEMMLGFETDTGDTQGKVTKTFEPQHDSDVPSPEKVREALDSFVGEIEQLPPMYSAVKYKGRKLYEYARKNKVVDRKARKVKIYGIELVRYKYPYVKFTAETSRGTYIRSLAVDIGKKLGVYATVCGLNRKRVGPFSVEESIDFNKLGDISCDELLRISKKYSGMIEAV